MEEISVILPVYNGEATIDLAIRSILEQQDVDLRLYICDDASTDSTPERLRAWAQRDPRVVICHNEKNLHAGGARNCCLAAAGGKYIALMDADDYSHPDRLKTQRDFLDCRQDLAFAGTRGRFFNREPGDLQEDYWFVRQPKPENFLMTLPFVHPSLMLRREVLESAGGYDSSPSSLRSEDYELLMRLYAAGHRGENLDEPLYYFRKDDALFLRRKYRYRLNECLVKWRGFSNMCLMPRGIPYALKPLVVGLMPKAVLEHMKWAYYRDR